MVDSFWLVTVEKVYEVLAKVRIEDSKEQRFIVEESLFLRFAFDYLS